MGVLHFFAKLQNSNVFFQPHTITNDKGRPVAHAGYITERSLVKRCISSHKNHRSLLMMEGVPEGPDFKHCPS